MGLLASIAERAAEVCSYLRQLKFADKGRLVKLGVGCVAVLSAGQELEYCR
jgi:hypothetical protein